MVISALVKSALLTGHLAIEPPKAPAVPEKTKPVAELNIKHNVGQSMQVAATWNMPGGGKLSSEEVARDRAPARTDSGVSVRRFIGAAAKAYQSHQAVKNPPPISNKLAMQRENLRAAAAAGDTDAARRLEGIREFEGRRSMRHDPPVSAPAVADSSGGVAYDPTGTQHYSTKDGGKY